MIRLNIMLIKHFLLSLIIPIVFFSIGIATMNDYGETTDEKFDQHIGEFYYYNWGRKGIEGLKERFIPLQRNYGPFFDIITVASNDILYKKFGIIKNPVASYHFPVLIISTIAIYIVFLFAYFNWGLIPGILSSFTLSLLPRFIGDSQNNLKDTPLMTFFSITLLLFFFAVKKKKLFLYVFAGIFLGLTYAIRVNALLILPIVLIWHLVSNKLNFTEIKKTIIGFCLSISSAFLTILVSWPYYRYDPITRFAETYSIFKNHEWNEYVLYLGQHYRGHDIPWHYPLIMFGVTTPIFYLILIVLGACLVFYSIFCNTRYKSSLVFVLIWIILPPLTQAVSGAPMYDGIRHYLSILPSLALIIGFTVWQIGVFLSRLRFKYKKYILIFYVTFILLNYVNLLRININLHPYQIVYFNELTGGVKGAKEKFDLDYWGQSLKETAEWINKNLPTGSRIWLTIPMAHHFPIDRERFHLVDLFPDYKISLIRGMLKTWDPEEDYLRPKKKPIYTITVDGGDILQIFEYSENKEINNLIEPLAFLEYEDLQNGILKTEYSNTNFEINKKTTVSRTPEFDCKNNEYNDRALSLFYTGYISIPKETEYCLKVTSDDYAILKINKKIVLRNSSMSTTIKKFFLKPGYYLFELQYINNIGPACLDIQLSIDKCRTFTPIPKEIFYYGKN